MSGKVLITGGFGNLGSWITLHLASLGYELYILTRKEEHKFLNIQYQVIDVDITNLMQLKEKLDFDIDYCVHLASFNEFFLPNYPQKALDINTLGTRNLLEVLSKKSIKNFIYFSTFHVYGVQKGIIEENTPLSPRNDYASTHLFAEYYVQQFHLTDKLPYTILRLSNSYGAPIFENTSKWYLVLNDLAKTAFEKKSIILNSNGKAKRDFIWMGDVSIIVEKLLEKDASNDIYNVSAQKTYEVIELARKVQEVYFKRYKKTIEIEVNEKDKNSYEELVVENKKLHNFISFEVHEMIETEVEKIFDLLERK